MLNMVSTDISEAKFTDTCIVCDGNCKTCLYRPTFCTSCNTGMRLFSTRCMGIYSVAFSYTIDYTYNTFLSSSKIQDFIAALATKLSISANDIYISSIKSGSVLASGSASASS